MEIEKRNSSLIHSGLDKRVEIRHKSHGNLIRIKVLAQEQDKRILSLVFSIRLRMTKGPSKVTKKLSVLFETMVRNMLSDKGLGPWNKHGLKAALLRKFTPNVKSIWCSIPLIRDKPFGISLGNKTLKLSNISPKLVGKMEKGEETWKHISVPPLHASFPSSTSHFYVTYETYWTDASESHLISLTLKISKDENSMTKLLKPNEDKCPIFLERIGGYKSLDDYGSTNSISTANKCLPHAKSHIIAFHARSLGQILDGWMRTVVEGLIANDEGVKCWTLSSKLTTIILLIRFKKILAYVKIQFHARIRILRIHFEGENTYSKNVLLYLNVLVYIRLSKIVFPSGRIYICLMSPNITSSICPLPFMG
ncbi:hypothetical protein CR513_36838, partial [Mucuna pruriens]